MTIEEKAKAYDESIARAKAMIKVSENESEAKNYVWTIFPELAEIEDEKIRKAIIELVKQNSDILNPLNQSNMLAWLEKQGEQKPVDAIEEDNDFTIYHPIKNECSNKYECFPYSFYGSIKAFHNNEELLCFLRNCFYKEEDCEKWCREQNEQKPVEWSEEDELMRESIIDTLKLTFGAVQMKIDWLKSLRPQNTWKPSEEQMEALESATENCAYSEYQDNLRELITQLKKLREEGISMKQPFMLQSDCTNCKLYEGFGQCYEHGNNLIENCKDYRKE